MSLMPPQEEPPQLLVELLSEQVQPLEQNIFYD